MYLLDTNVLSEVVRRRPDAGVMERLKQLRVEETFASVVTLFEMRFGAMRRAGGREFWLRLEREVLSLVRWVPMDEKTAKRAGDIAAELEGRGSPVGVEDTFIAATALEHNLVVVTRNVRHFRPVPGLAVEDWFGEA